KSVADAIRKLSRDSDLQGISLDTEKRMVVRSSDDVIDLVAQYFKLTRSDLTGDNRKKEVMIPRQICMYLIRETLDHSYETIGESFGGRNHTTVLHACNKILGQMKEDNRIMRDINAIKREIGV
ncbi:hypothetical protein KJ951_03680, partial [Patescibacteria group bacterium]|nr:hypothetical protein [Patescibacteria group bacterium]MBU1703478.1 hypothetical protein [Patescibacteria group bacterium]